MRMCIFFISICVCLSMPLQKAFAGGSLNYDAIRDTFYNNNTVLFDTLEQGIIFTQMVWADVRISSTKSAKWSGLRLGPYYICAIQKFGKHLPLVVTIATEIAVFSKNGEEVDDIDEKTEVVQEKITGILIEELRADTRQHGYCKFLLSDAPVP